MARDYDFSEGYGPWLVDEISWVYSLNKISKPPEEFGIFRDFKALWDSKRREGRLPAWTDFAFEEFAPWWGQLALEDIIPGPEYDTVFRLWGTALTQLLDTELTGKNLRSTFDTAYNEIEIPLFERIAGEHLIVVSFGPMNWTNLGQWSIADKVAFIQMPLATDGEHVDKILSLVLEIDDDSDLPWTPVNTGEAEPGA
ncbi:MAG: hypothetical protein RIC16_00670 [Rhodospirillales bacterium]